MILSFFYLVKMDHLNEAARDFSLAWRVIELFVPNMYRAESIKDFEDNRNIVKRSYDLVSFGAFFNWGARLGSSLVFLENVTYEGLEDVDLTNVKISDLSGSLTLNVPSFWGHQQELLDQGINQGDRIAEVTIVYTPKNDYAQLLEMKKIDGTPIIEEDVAENLERVLVPT